MTVLLVHAVTLDGPTAWLVASCAAETLAATVVYALVVAPAPRVAATRGNRSTKQDTTTDQASGATARPSRPSRSTRTRTDQSA